MLFRRGAAAGIIVALLFPFVTHAIPFGGSISILLRCYNTAIFTLVGPPRGGQYIWSPATRTYQFGAPRAVGQWLLGLASAPYYCVYSIFPVLVAPGLHIDMMGSSGSPASISLSTALNQGTPPPGAPPGPPPAVGVGSPGPVTGGSGVGRALIGEVFGIVDSSHGADPQNEWIEIYNGAGSTINFSGWRLVWGAATTTLPATSLDPGQIVIFSPGTTTRSFWNIPSNVSVVAVSGAANLGESGLVRLIDPTGVVVDAVSWGSNTGAFSPAAPTLRVGHSLVRTTVLSDTNTANDWSDRAEPSPGN
ncbi:MAG TPA: lamin tail domain-containing protein [Candidatus Paceibacterota bacterium]|nr:lamin tail domain-containing protein [Candidatus Paceibacterota bacterium]